MISNMNNNIESATNPSIQNFNIAGTGPVGASNLSSVLNNEGA